VHRAAGAVLALVLLSSVAVGASSADAAGVSRPGTRRDPKCSTTIPAGGPTASVETIDFDGAPREYRLAVPSTEPGPHGLPLILNFHGYGSNTVQQAVYSELEKKGPANGYVVVTPQGTGDRAFWNIVPNLARPDDVAFASALIDAAAQHACIDTRRLYATGISNGAGMSTLLGCKRPRVYAAIAPVAGINLIKPCPKGPPVSVLAFHGHTDPVVAYGGGSNTTGRSPGNTCHRSRARSHRGPGATGVVRSRRKPRSGPKSVGSRTVAASRELRSSSTP
jgi:polyhydroxybutyrate depolymerase